MSSRNAYLSKLLFAQSLEQFDFPYRDMRYLFFTPKKGQRHYGSVAKQSHVIVDYRPLFENYNNLLDSVMFFIDTGYLSDFYYLFNKKRKFIKIKSLTIQQIKEIYEANTVLFAKLKADIAEIKLIDEINKI